MPDKRYLVLLRGINVGGKNKLPMAQLKSCLEDLGYQNVRTYIASGNAIFESGKKAKRLAEEIEDILPRTFALDAPLVRVLVLSADEIKRVVDQAPAGFGDEPAKYRYYV